MFSGLDVTQWDVRGSFRCVFGGGCDAVQCERQFKAGFGRRM